MQPFASCTGHDATPACLISMKKLLLPSLAPQNASHKLFLLAISLFCVSAAQAQVKCSIGPQVGYTLSTTHFTKYTNQFNASYRSGIEIGVLASLRVRHFALQPAIVYAQKGYGLDFTIPGDFATEELRYTGTTRLDYLTFPLNLVYSQHATGQGWQVFAGPYLSRLVGGRYSAKLSIDRGSTGINNPNPAMAGLTGKVASESNYDPTTANTIYSKRVDAGLQGGVGYQYQRCLLRATYSLGLRDVQYKKFVANVDFGELNMPAYNRAFLFSFTYLFEPKS